jgi:hypothetical protein
MEQGYGSESYQAGWWTVHSPLQQPPQLKVQLQKYVEE